MPSPQILVIGTCDTKLNELLFLRKRILERGNCDVILLDMGRTPVLHEAITTGCEELSNYLPLPSGARDIAGDMSRKDYIDHIIKCTRKYVEQLRDSKGVNGVVSIGGSCGTSLAAAVMKTSFPVGFPKLIVSTVASGDVAPFIGDTDITMMYSVVDISGYNRILNQVLANAAGAIDGMVTANARHVEEAHKEKKKKKTIATTMFGLTTPCVEKMREYLEEFYECEVIIFHATGSGGRAMERLVKDGLVDAVADVTTTEVADEIAGGIFPGGPQRLSAAAEAGIPQIISLGACDMVNFGAKETVPDKFRSRLLHEHNPAITLMRTEPEECRQMGEFIASQLRNHAKDPSKIKVLIPEKGVSKLAVSDGPFHDLNADEALFSSIEKGLQSSQIAVERHPRDINDPDFAVTLAKELISLIEQQ
ncbi:hypothetical protein KEM56_001934 [Ascosphaera pollenicola]|nr:hypothetical protein KEM56_001934 [Ascosphaera pollenicola]